MVSFFCPILNNVSAKKCGFKESRLQNNNWIIFKKSNENESDKVRIKIQARLLRLESHVYVSLPTRQIFIKEQF